MNNRKAELKEDRMKNDLKIQELHHKLSLNISALKTELESTKLQLLTQWASGIFVFGVGSVFLLLKAF